MTQKKSIRIEGERQVFILVPETEFNQLTANQKRILELLQDSESTKGPGIGDYISKEEAERITGRKGTTLWKLRKDGKIKSAKMGNEVFYSRKSILDYLNQNLR